MRHQALWAAKLMDAPGILLVHSDRLLMMRKNLALGEWESLNVMEGFMSCDSHMESCVFMMTDFWVCEYAALAD